VTTAMRAPVLAGEEHPFHATPLSKAMRSPGDHLTRCLGQKFESTQPGGACVRPEGRARRRRGLVPAASADLDADAGGNGRRSTRRQSTLLRARSSNSALRRSMVSDIVDAVTPMWRADQEEGWPHRRDDREYWPDDRSGRTGSGRARTCVWQVDLGIAAKNCPTSAWTLRGVYDQYLVRQIKFNHGKTFWDFDYIPCAYPRPSRPCAIPRVLFPSNRCTLVSRPPAVLLRMSLASATPISSWQASGLPWRAHWVTKVSAGWSGHLASITGRRPRGRHLMVPAGTCGGVPPARRYRNRPTGYTLQLHRGLRTGSRFPRSASLTR
jgi:hypothetical protein